MVVVQIQCEVRGGGVGGGMVVVAGGGGRRSFEVFEVGPAAGNTKHEVCKEL